MSAASKIQLSEDMLSFLSQQQDGCASDDSVKQYFGPAKYELLATIINVLLKSNRLQLFTLPTGGLVYKAVQEEMAAKLEGLEQEQVLVHQSIERSGDKGIWTRDIKNNTNISQHNLTKALKVLEQRMLIKSVRSVASKSKKLYMLYDLEPAKEVTGGPWYTDGQDFDHAFVSALGNFVTQLVRSHGMLDLSTICDKIKISGISKVELSVKEVELVLNSLVFDGRLEDVQSSILLVTGYAAAKKVYKAAKPMSPPASLTMSPCGMCPVIAHCSEGGAISPTTCEYMSQWLEVAGGGGAGDLKLSW
jgi:DNA-directed RNA polymerase III subunit RPC6